MKGKVSQDTRSEAVMWLMLIKPGLMLRHFIEETNVVFVAFFLPFLLFFAALVIFTPSSLKSLSKQLFRLSLLVVLIIPTPFFHWLLSLYSPLALTSSCAELRCLSSISLW